MDGGTCHQNWQNQGADRGQLCLHAPGTTRILPSFHSFFFSPPFLVQTESGASSLSATDRGPAAPSAPQNSRRSGTITICMDPCCRHFVAFPGTRDNVIRRPPGFNVFASVTFKAPTQFRPKFRGLRIEPSRHGQSYINLLLLRVDCCIFLSLSSARHSFLLLRSILESYIPSLQQSILSLSNRPLSSLNSNP